MPSIDAVINLIGIAAAASGALVAYVAIRSDLAALKAVQVMHTDGITRAHDRIDGLARFLKSH